MGKISTNQQAEANAIAPALPPQAAPLVEALDAMKALQGRQAAAEARAAFHAQEIEPLRTALGDKLAAGGEGDDAALVEVERQHRRAVAEAEGLGRLIEAQRVVVQVAMVGCEVAHREAATRAKTTLDGRLKASATRYLAALAELQALHYAAGASHDAFAVGSVRIPVDAYGVPDPSLWVGVGDQLGDTAPTANDATQQLDAMAMLVRQAQGVVANG